MKFPLVLDVATDGIPVAVACGVLGFSKQASYAWKRHRSRTVTVSDAHLINAALDVLSFGQRFIADGHEHLGFVAGENLVGLLCSSKQIWSVFAKKRGLTRRVGSVQYDSRDIVEVPNLPSAAALSIGAKINMPVRSQQTWPPVRVSCCHFSRLSSQAQEP